MPDTIEPMDPIPWHEIVSEVIDTAGGKTAWLQQDVAGHVSVRCAGCDLNEYAPAMAPGLIRMRGHADGCVR